ncbi:mechanosensitive ion channel [Gracilibacillus massiliensis]|uniref:mechanosensitive ion channel n=1 Tax=Gracilibacillus massiliensis TaxID=1564956 RepID=UPI00071D830F|nr:mechanosensitive ion channel [Gracilibacillus massiliensis]
MNDLGNSFAQMFNNVIQAIPNVIAALLLLILAWIVAAIAKGIVEKLFVKLGVHRAIGKTNFVEDEEKGKQVLSAIAKVVYLLVFILFLPAILDALSMDSVSGPISNMMDKLLGFLPNLIAAAVILIIGYVIAKLVKELFERFLVSVNVDKWFNKVKPASKPNSGSTMTLSSVLANVLFVVIIIPVITIALEALEIQTISEPITQVLDSVLMMIPNIFIAIVLVIVGYYLGKILGNLLEGLLQGTGINNVFSSIGIDNAESKVPFDISKAIGTVVKVLVILFFTVEALSVLQLEVLNQIGSAMITYLPFLVSALLILGGGILLGSFLASFIRKYTHSGFTAAIVKYVVIVFAVFMTLDQLKFATSIVNTAFILILGGLMVAFAISFGIGGRDFARNQLSKVESKMKKDNNSNNHDNDSLN